MARIKNCPQKHINPLMRQLLTKTSAKQMSQKDIKPLIKIKSELIPKSLKSSISKERKSSRSIAGSHVLRDFRIFEKNRRLLIPKKCFQSLVQEIAEDMHRIEGIRFQTTALMAIQESAEGYLVSVFEDMDLCAKHANRVTVQMKDFRLALRLRPDSRK